ncbi:MAG: hypothetical protein COV55_00950 [Candidatus Komeilibacteria bacterium CG11_big_fil_rev_8_21_14_0_20_36_20]|uniref:UDP-glucose 6-dehydrogenase n=1 Tax=Candidatus Komeilibacteria bacterium CG11_big_fil_rev_8_21_14_0_20_36_20 TaxID=1974477 RepID=A0A2H0NDL6_9BACT|nr:MAG: hypothetical protein COV55_00950 [Candidatus Komeilibacteria bacterium CG11_big_fil_rev_8_21_14_0_20_36_20]PIR81348.1 MAG: hypothetical protein COU21_03920 [Candidatus Komeilibacteria bacterium CG10_big_fil_rev_8_21_14_0_10_36_65]PJC54978.1 MAG: hypothetical protein CO027_04590 [Candidatus Komeilibacteria bacterium CG_4_9_14_0_2_um_filter_36_13]
MIVAIIQARMSAERLPNKVIADIAGKPMIWHVVNRVKSTSKIDKVILATSDKLIDQKLVEVASQIGIDVYTGSESDVLDRYYQAAKKYKTDIIVRITGDCPLIDPNIIDKTIEYFLKNNFDYVSTAHTNKSMDSAYPDGLDTEVFNFSSLEKAWKEAKLKSEREHVTPYIWNNSQIFKINTFQGDDCDQDYSQMRWTVDEERDLKFVREVYKNLYKDRNIFFMKDILNLLKDYPELLEINSDIKRDDGYFKSLKEEEQLAIRSLMQHQDFSSVHKVSEPVDKISLPSVDQINKISIFGLGYVGCVSAACLAKNNFEIIGVDVNPIKIGAINQGVAPLIETELGPLIKSAVECGRLKATDDVDFAIINTAISVICVGTPSLANGSIDYTSIEKAITTIAKALLVKNSEHTIIIRSTILPGTIDSIIKPMLLKICGEKVFKNIKLCHNPEFLREGSAIFDFYNPPKIIIGAEDEKDGKFLMDLLYNNVSGEKMVTDIKTAETVKYVDNVFHALKVSFANEIDTFCKSAGVNSHKVMEIFCKDRKLNLSPYYLKPGKPFGGSCLPKDLNAFVNRAKKRDLELPVIFNILNSNNMHIKNILKTILSFNKKKIGIIGLSFKENTDDLRNSPMIDIVEHLIGKGIEVSIFDKNIYMARIFGANKNYIINHIPHISSLLTDNLKELVKFSEIIVIANKEEKLLSSSDSLFRNKIVIDLSH